MSKVQKLILKIALSTLSTFLIFLAFLTFSTIFAKDAHAGPKGYGWVSYRSIGGVACNASTSNMVVWLYNESGSAISGGSITLNGSSARSSGQSIGCYDPAAGFTIKASHSGYQSFSSAFSLMSSVVSAGRNHTINIAVYLTNTRTIDIISPTSGNFPTSPVTFTLFIRALPAIGASSAAIYAIVDGSYTQVAASAPFGTITVPVSMSSGASHTVAFAFRQNTSPYPVSAVTPAVTITVGGKPDLIITGLSTNKSTYLPGETVNAAISIKNQGIATAGAFTTIYRFVDFTSCTPEGSQARWYKGSLAPNGTATWDTISFTAPSTPGTYTIYAMVDVYCEVSESNESNNRRTVKYTVAAPSAPTCTITAAPRSINLGDSSTISWNFGTSAVSGRLYEMIGQGYILLQDNIPRTGSRTVTPTVNTTYFVRVTDIYGQTGTCSTAVEILVPSPVPSPTPPPSPSPPPSPPPSPSPPDTLTLIPNQCENALETDKLTDNYITEPGKLTPPIPPLGGVTLTGTLNQEVTIPLNVSFSVDFSKLQALFGYPNSDYLEGRFQQPSHRDENLLDLKSADFNNFHGAAQKAEPKYLSDLEKVKYVHYVYNKPEIAESPNKYANIKGLEPKTVKELVDLYGLPVPPTSGDRSYWLATWGPYWPKIPTAYNELYKGKLEFAVVGSEKSFEDLKNGSGCASASARTVEFIVPDFGRTTLVADQLNQVIVPYAAQSFRDHRTQDQGVGLGPPKNFLAKAVDFCKKIISAPASVVRGLQKVIKVSLNFFSPVKTVYAQDEDQGPTCIKILSPGKEGNAPYCALPTDQIQPGDSCANKITPNKLNPDNPNVVCTFQIGSFTTTINPQNPFWDVCVDNGDGTYKCTVNEIRVYPNFRLPWISEIWNSTLYSDSNEAGLGSVQGAKTDERGQVLQGETSIGIGSPQVTGRPGIYQSFIPKVAYNSLFPTKFERAFDMLTRCYPNWPDQTRADCEDMDAIGDIIPFLPNPDIKIMAELISGKLGKTLPGEVADSGSVQGAKTGSGGQVLAETTGASDTRERFVGAVDCGKHFARDVSLKPKALQTYLGIGANCNLQAAAIPETEIPGGGGDIPPPTDCTSASDGNPLNGIETSSDELKCYIIEIASGDVDPMSGDNLADLMQRMMQIESGGGRQCAVGGADEIGVFQYTAGTWKGALGAILNPPTDSGSGTLAQDNAGRQVCWGLPGEDPNLNTGHSWFSWPLNFGQNKDGDAWNPYKQIVAARAKILDRGACIWTSYSGKNTPDPNDGLHPENCL